MRVVVLSLATFAWSVVAVAAEPPCTRVVQVRPSAETPGLSDNAFESDGDDPEIWAHPPSPGRAS
jgi:hypothetical protein